MFTSSGTSFSRIPRFIRFVFPPRFSWTLSSGDDGDDGDGDGDDGDDGDDDEDVHGGDDVDVDRGDEFRLDVISTLETATLTLTPPPSTFVHASCRQRNLQVNRGLEWS